MGLSGHNYACEGSTKLAVKTKEVLQKGGSIEPMEPPLDPPLEIVAELVASRQAKCCHYIISNTFHWTRAVGYIGAYPTVLYFLSYILVT